MARSAEGFRPETGVAVAAVERALELARGGADPAGIRRKGERDLVTATDVAAEDAVRGILTERLGWPVVGEERGGEPPADGSPYWLVDPICGTRNFASGIPLYCVNLALVEDGRVTVAVVADPPAGEIDVAQRDGGAWALRDGAPRALAASAASKAIVVEDSQATGARREHAARFAADAVRADRWDLLALGSTLSLPYVAAGRVGAYVLFSGSAVHVAAGSLLAAEAGATVSQIDGAPWTVRSDSIVASADPALHQELLELAARAAT